MTSALPRRTRPPLLPPLGLLIIDNPAWRFRGGNPPGEGVARLRVWAAQACYVAVVTESGEGLPALAALPAIWEAVAASFAPVQLLLHSPAALDPRGRDSADLVAVPALSGEQWRTVPVHPAGPSTAEFCDAWWDRFGLQITAG